jgi:hypothetical protein
LLDFDDWLGIIVVAGEKCANSLKYVIWLGGGRKFSILFC